MKSKEIYLCVIAFFVLLMTFGIVVVTADYTEKSLEKPAQRLSEDSSQKQIHKDCIHNSTENLERVVPPSKPKRTPLIAPRYLSNKRPSNSWSSRARRTRAEIKERLTPVESKGRVYLENTTGIEAACEEDNNDEGNIEIIE